MKKLIETTTQHYESFPYLYLPHFEAGGKVGQFDLSNDRFTELSTREVPKTKIARGYYAVLDGELIAFTATTEGPCLLINNRWYLFKQDEIKINFISGSRENHLKISINNKSILSAIYEKPEDQDVDSWASEEEDLDFGAKLFQNQNDPDFYRWHTLSTSSDVSTKSLTGLLLKIDRVASLEEALELEKQGAGVIGVSLEYNNAFNDQRVVSVSFISELCSQLHTAKLAVQIPPTALDDKELIQTLDQAQIAYLQFNALEVDDTLFDKIKNLGPKIIISGIDADYDTDPAWILSPFEVFKSLGENIYFQIELLTGVDDSWNFFKDQCPADEDLLQIEDLVQLAGEHQLLISLDFTADNISEIMEKLSAIKGLALTLGDLKTKNFPYHSFSWNQTQALLSNLP